MKNSSFGTYALALSLLIWGVLLGGVLYSHLVFFPVFLSNLPESSSIVTGTYGLNEAPFWMTIHPILVLSLIVALISNWRTRRRYLIAVSLVIYVVILIISAVYFVPELIAFGGSLTSDVPKAEWMARGSRWYYLSCTRGIILFLSSAPLIVALRRRSDQNADR